MTATTQINRPTLQLGSTGSAVVELQKLMRQLLQRPDFVVDGVFGAKTQSAVKEVQERFFLTVDGVVGNKTWNVLLSGHNSELPVLRRGSQGELVRRVQCRLATNGYTLGQLDGAFGAKTEAAVKRFQTDFRLVVDGIIGPKTWQAMSHLFPYQCAL